MSSIPTFKNNEFIDDKSQFILGLKRYIVRPIKAGIYGFTLVFIVIISVKFLSFWLGINEVFNLDLIDVMLSSVGFFFMSLVYILKNFH